MKHNPSVNQKPVSFLRLYNPIFRQCSKPSVIPLYLGIPFHRLWSSPSMIIPELIINLVTIISQLYHVRSLISPSIDASDIFRPFVKWPTTHPPTRADLIHLQTLLLMDLGQIWQKNFGTNFWWIHKNARFHGSMAMGDPLKMDGWEWKSPNENGCFGGIQWLILMSLD